MLSKDNITYVVSTCPERRRASQYLRSVFWLAHFATNRSTCIPGGYCDDFSRRWCELDAEILPVPEVDFRFEMEYIHMLNQTSMMTMQAVIIGYVSGSRLINERIIGWATT
jgi:hypothetical protein